MPDTTPDPAPTPDPDPIPAPSAEVIDTVVADPAEGANIVSVEEDEWMEEFLWNLNHYIGENVRFSDTKAGSVIVLSGAVLSLLYSGGFHHTFARPLGEWRLDAVAALLTFMCLGGAVLAAAWSIRPRLVRNFAAGYVFWESILAHGSSQAFVQELNRRTRRELLDHLAVQIFSVSAVASTKFRWVGRATLLCMTGAVLGAIVLVAAR